MVFAEATALGSAVIRDASGATLFEVGQGADGVWASFIWLVGSWRLFQHAQGARIRSLTFTQDGLWVAPRGVTQLVFAGYGGGGGGGSGGDTSGGTRGWAISGGGGGGGVVLGVQIVTVIPGVAYAIRIGDGGEGAPSGASYDGFDGGDTVLESEQGTLARVAGAQGGASVDRAESTGIVLSYGGGPVRGAPPFDRFGDRSIYFESLTAAGRGRLYSGVPGQGGFGTSAPIGGSSVGWGAANLLRGPFSDGGAPGEPGVLSPGGLSFGGGGGGGGGGPRSDPTSPEGRAPGGGNGGNGLDADVGAPGANGGSAPPNSGAGGGGGGGAGIGQGRAGEPGGGGKAGSGMATISWVQ